MIALRLTFCSLLLLFGSTGVMAAEPVQQKATPTSTKAFFNTYKSPQCGCCKDWVKHMSDAGFEMRDGGTENLSAIKRQYGIQPGNQSCHTAVHSATDYVFEGHIPAHLIARFLEEKPEGALGLAVPGMPIGSPGMEMGDRYDSYDVIMLMQDGSSHPYAHVKGNHH